MLLTAGCVALSFFYSQCKKGASGQQDTGQIVAAAKAWLQSERTAGNSLPAFVDSLTQMADWPALVQHAISPYEFIAYVPLAYNSNTTGLVYVFSKKTNVVEQGYVLETSGSTNPDQGALVASFYSYQMSSGLTVTMTAYDLGKAMIWKMGYRDGVNTYHEAIVNSRIVTPPAAVTASSAVAPAGRGHQEVTGDGGCTDYYLVTYYDDGSEDWDYIGTGCAACTVFKELQHGNRPNAIVADGITTTCGGSGGGGGGASSSTAVDSVTQNLVNPCFVSVLKTLMGTGMTNAVSNILINVFGTSETLNLTYNQATSISGSPTADAATNPSKSGDYLNITTTLSTSQLANASQEFIAETMFHEAIHAFLDTNSVVASELNQHVTMLQSWVTAEVTALQQVFPNLTTVNAECLVLGGFQNVQEAQPATFAQALTNLGLTATQVQNTNNSYKAGQTGTACPPANGGSGGGGGGGTHIP